MKRVVIATLVAMLVPIVPASADSTSTGGSLEGDGVSAWVRHDTAGRPTAPRRRMSRRLPSTWTTVSYAPSATYGIACPDAAVRIVTRHFRHGSRRVASVTCSRWPRTAGRPTWAPPTSVEVADSVELPIASPAINPRVRGLVGLETWLWYEGPLDRTVTVVLGGTHVTARATAVAFELATGDGAAYHSAVPGSESDPAARHVYRRHQTYTVTVTVVWQGTFSFLSPDGAAGTRALGTIRTSASRTYPVVESQAVRTR